MPTGGSGEFGQIGGVTLARRRPLTGDPRLDADIYSDIQRRNPFPANSPSYYGSIAGMNWQLGQEGQARQTTQQFRQNLSQMLQNRGTSGGPFAGSPFSIPSPVGTPATPTNPFGLVSVSKDPSGRFDRINNALLGRVEGFQPNYDPVRSSSQSTVSALTDQSYDANQAANRGDTQTLIDKFRSIQPLLNTQTTAQTGAIDRVYDGGLKTEFAQNTQNAADAERRLAGRAIQNALFQNRLGSAGGAGSGYANAQAADAVGRISAETAARDADRRRQDTAALLAAQERNLGRTQDLNTQNVLRERIPVEARNSLLDNEARQASQRLAAMGQAVTIDQLTDELTTVGRQLGLSSQALQNYLASNFLGVNRVGDDYPLYISGMPSRSSPQSYNPDPGYVGPQGQQPPPQTPPSARPRPPIRPYPGPYYGPGGGPLDDTRPYYGPGGAPGYDDPRPYYGPGYGPGSDYGYIGGYSGGGDYNADDFYMDGF